MGERKEEEEEEEVVPKNTWKNNIYIYIYIKRERERVFNCEEIRFLIILGII